MLVWLEAGWTQKVTCREDRVRGRKSNGEVGRKKKEEEPMNGLQREKD